jgi:succinoglycan biosynthesis protein ExoO
MSKKPLISVIVANYNCESYLRESLASALNQSIKNIEIILVDDNSTDKGLEIALELSSKDERLKVISLKDNLGPSGARNKALEIAQGEWIAIMDSDDMMHPHRLKKLLHTAIDKNADIIVDDLYIFDTDGEVPAYNYLHDAYSSPHWVLLPDFIQSNSFDIQNTPGYGILKPLIHRNLLKDNGITYDESLKNSEDYDIIVKLMIAGANYLLVPYPGYYYRKHSASISYRLNVDMLEKMYEADKKIKPLIPSNDNDSTLAANRRHVSIKNMLSFQKVIEALKQGQYSKAILEVLYNPRLVPFFLIPISDKLKSLKFNLKQAGVLTPEYKNSSGLTPHKKYSYTEQDK